MQRYCVALVLPQPLGERLDRARRVLQPMRRHMPAHITLVPPVSLTAEDAERARARVHEVAEKQAPIPFALRGCDTFAPTMSTAYLCVACGDEPMREMAETLAQSPFPPRRRSVHPHVTIASRASSSVISSALLAFADFEAAGVIDSLAMFAFADEGWRMLSEGRMGGSRP